MKLISWNVNGLRACADKGFAESFKALDADFFCLQETKMQAGQLDLQFEGYTSYWNYAFVNKDGWVDMVNEDERKWINNFYDRFIATLDPNDLVTIYECSVNNG